MTFTPTAPGDYLIAIKFAGTNIAGSPFKCTVGGNIHFILIKFDLNKKRKI